MMYLFNEINLFVIINLILFSKEDLIINPLIFDEGDFNDYSINIISVKVTLYYEYKNLKILKDDECIEYKDKLYYLPSNFYLCKDESSNYFLFANYDYYSKNPKEKNNKIESLGFIKSLPSDIKYNGFIREKEYKYENPLTKIKKDEIIIYGKSQQKIYFIYIKENCYFSINIDKIGDIISCKYIRGSRYACAYFKENKIYLSVIIRKIISYESYSNKYGLEIYNTIEIEESQDYDKLFLYDTNEQFYKILCYSSKKNNIIKCCAIYCEIWHKTEKNYVYGSLKKIRLKENYKYDLSKLHNCYLNEFNNEFILCCGINNHINCNRNNLNNFNLINQFSISLSGKITNIILENKFNHLIISYNNEEISSKNYLYKYYIYPPQCRNISKQINSFQESEINISELFEKNTNTKYYIRFHNLPASIKIKIGVEEINSNLFELKPEIEKLYLIYNNYESKINCDIIYDVSIEETYSSKCQISLTINKCYYSCRGCFLDINNSSDSNHNCINCRDEEKYYPYSEKPNNCYKEEEMKDKFKFE